MKVQKSTARNWGKEYRKAAKYLKDQGLLPAGLKERTTRLLAGATLAGSLLLSPLRTEPTLLEKPAEERMKLGLVTSEEMKKILAQRLTPLMPEIIGKLTPEEEEKICGVIEDVLGVDVCANLEGHELNHAYAWTGYEQHLYRYPGDELEQHDEELVAGIAPGLGAWGYFCSSRGEMVEKDLLREKYYVAVQTLYLPEWSTQSEELYQWYKYRKMMMINPENGTACVVVVGDAGPADWTGKQFGGSPEVMKALDLHLRMRKGKVLLLFVNDPEDRVPLGPIDFNLDRGRVEEA